MGDGRGMVGSPLEAARELICSVYYITTWLLAASLASPRRSVSSEMVDS